MYIFKYYILYIIHLGEKFKKTTLSFKYLITTAKAPFAVRTGGTINVTTPVVLILIVNIFIDSFCICASNSIKLVHMGINKQIRNMFDEFVMILTLFELD